MRAHFGTFAVYLSWAARANGLKNGKKRSSDYGSAGWWMFHLLSSMAMVFI